MAQSHFELAGMLERAAMIGGKLEARTAPDFGTVVVLKVPRRRKALSGVRHDLGPLQTYC